MYDFYTTYYNAVAHSRAHAEFCESAYGKNLAQHGFMTMEQLDKLIGVTRLGAQNRVLDLGCGNGLIAEYISDMTGACVMGVDYIPAAVASARERTRAKLDRLDFCVGDLTHLDLPPKSFDTLLSIDTIYFSDDYPDTLHRWLACLTPHGQMAIFFSYGVDPEHPKETFDVTTLPPDRTMLGVTLRQMGLEFETWDYTRQDYELARRKKEALERLKPEFEAEGNQFLYGNRIGETLGVMAACECAMHARYLYHVKLDGMIN